MSTQSKVQEGKRTEYQTVGNRRRREVRLSARESRSKSSALNALDLYRKGGVYTRVRIQKRTVTESQWEDVSDV